MDPLKALTDLDAVVSKVAMDRATHAHFLLCVSTIRQALTTEKPSGDNA
jgi:hypothetical protein